MWTRSTVRPILIRVEGGWDLRSDAPRRAWTAVLGPSTVTTYLRLREAAVRGTILRRPPGLDTLLTERIVAVHRGQLLVPDRVPELTVQRLRASTAGRHLLYG